MTGRELVMHSDASSPELIIEFLKYIINRTIAFELIKNLQRIIIGLKCSHC